MRDGKLPPPPIAKALDFTVHEVEPGRIVFKTKPAEFHMNPLGTVHGGMFGVLLDSAMSCAVQTELKAGEIYTTAEYKVNMLRPMTINTPEVFAEGRVISRGRRMGVAEGDIKDADGKIYAHGTTTCFIMPAN